ncbi:MAG: EamA family transporter RarD [Micromonosporaceae bacterium]|nr:EamA family transporter RarD [Micromonosporaceae bacterium]
MSEPRRGYLYGLTAFGLWGLLPLYWKLLVASDAVEILAHRIAWSVVFVAGLLVVLRRWSWLRDLVRQPRRLLAVLAAAALIGINWVVFIYGVTSDRVVETSLGYFINPLMSVLLGVLVMGERLRIAQWIAIGFGAVAVAVLTVDYGRLPWIALAVACSFALYGLVKKKLGLPAAEGLFAESSALLLPALAYVGWLVAADQNSFGTISLSHTLLLAGGGVATAVPLLFFAGTANRVPLSALGMMQYLGPSIMFVLGVLVFGEPMPAARLAGFVLVWGALALFTWDGLRRRGAPGGHIRRLRAREGIAAGAVHRG